MNLLYFELKKKTKGMTFFFLMAFLLVGLLFTVNHFLNQQDNEGIKETMGIDTDILSQTTFSGETKAYLQNLNEMISLQEDFFRAATGSGKDISDSLTLPTYPAYRTQLNNELIKRALPVYSMRYGTKNSVFVAILLTYLASLLGIVVVFVLFGDSFSSEIEKNNLNFLLVQPASRKKLFLMKYVASLLQAILLVALLLLFGFILATLLAGESSFRYPMIVFTEISMTFIPVGQYIFQMFLLFVFVLAFAFACHFIVSLLCKKVFLALFSTVFILLEGYIVSTLNIPFMNKLAHYNPFIYLNVGKIFIGYDFKGFFQYNIENQTYYSNYCLPRVLHNSEIQFTNGLLTLSIATILLLLVGLRLLKENGQQWQLK